MSSTRCKPQPTPNLFELHPGHGFNKDRPDLRPTVAEFQQLLNDATGANISVDGYFGEETTLAVENIQQANGFEDDGIIRPGLWLYLQHLRDTRPKRGPLRWGQLVSERFRERVHQMAGRLGTAWELPSWLMAVMHFETGGSFDPAQRNLAGSSAVGLIQFMPATAAHLLGMDPDRKAHREEAARLFAAMSDVQQLGYVEKYFRPYRGRLENLSDVYMAVLYPAAVGKPQDYTLFGGGIAYRQNSGLDVDQNGRITKEEATAKVAGSYKEGVDKLA